MSTYPKTRRRRLFLKILKEFVLLVVSIAVLSVAAFFIWISTLTLPDFNNFENRNVANSTKIYDRTGKVVLYDLYQNVRRTQVPLSEISIHIQNATISIEDAEFYQHNGFKPRSFIRAALVNASSGSYKQGGSTITQQVVKNSLLTREKTISRKMKEILLAIKLDGELTKEEILSIYLNENPYGGTIYGVEEASLSYFGKKAKDVDLVEAAYLASLPQSPTYYSPYGQNREALERRKNLVLTRMYELGYINFDELEAAKKTYLSFNQPRGKDAVGMHFVFFVREYLEKKYGQETVLNGGLRVVTTLDYTLQKDLEALVKEQTFSSLIKNKATNAALVAIDPKTGQIVSLVGSRNFFDEEIPGQFNIAVAKRQPGSSFKPIVYAAAFEKGFTPETVLYDVPTQFSARCDAYGEPLTEGRDSDCYMPENYDNKFRGPISLRDALAQSLNIPAVKLLYLTGLDNAIRLANRMGLSTINDPARYGLSLVLGGGEVTLLELVNAYATLAHGGIYTPYSSIISVTDKNGVLLESYSAQQTPVLSKNTASLVSSVLSDNTARTPSYGANSPLNFGDRPVAVKTGTTNDFRDLWVVGYTPSITLGMWAGNNDNTPIEKKVSGQLLGPIWRKAMERALSSSSIEYFDEPLPNVATKPILRGDYCFDGPKTILGLVNKFNVSHEPPLDPTTDPQFELWQTPILNYVSTNNVCGFSTSSSQIASTTLGTTTIPISN